MNAVAYKKLINERDNLKSQATVYQNENMGLKEENSHLKKQIEWFQRQMFGQKSERITDFSEMPFLPGMEFTEEVDQKDEGIAVPAHTRKASKKNDTSIVIPDDLPRKTKVIDIPEEEKLCPETGECLVEIGRDITEKLAFTPGEYYVKRIERPKYAVKKNSLAGILQAPAPDSILEGSKFDPSFMAHVATEKFAYHMPLNRVIEKLATRQIKVSSQTMSSLILNLGNKVVPLLDLMEKKTFEQKVIFTDDTPVKLIKEGRGKAKQAHMWIYLGGKPNAPPYHIYRFSESRSHTVPKGHLKNYKGVFHADAFGAYETIDEDIKFDIKWAACWSHARRKFYEAGNSPFIKEVLRKMRYLFMYERVAWEQEPDKRLLIRQKKEQKLVNEIFELMKDKIRKNDLTPKSTLAQAMGYMLTREENFRRYLDNPDLRMDNNPAERALRKLVIGRKNWLFVGSSKSGNATAALLSLVQTCRAMKIDPQQYLEDIFTRLMSHPAKRLEELLPDQWQ